MTKWNRLILGLSTGLMVLATQAVAEVKLPSVISDNMVLQQKMRVPIWGTADPGEKITVAIGKDTARVEADSAGKWKVNLEPIEAGGPYKLTVSGKNTITLSNILVGEVWVCSGQSNMQMAVKSCNNANQEIAAANFPKIRLYTVPNRVSPQPLSDTPGKWVECSPQTVPGFSAVGYFFGRDLQKAIGVPIGLINTSWGGTPAESWTARRYLEANPDYQPILDRWKGTEENNAKAIAQYDVQLADWRSAAAKAKAEGKEVPAEPKAPGSLDGNPYRPAGLYNAMIAPLIPYGIAGAIWYQGESNAVRAYQYRTLFPTMIRNWRKEWGQGTFPFLFVQLAAFGEANLDHSWSELREAQTMTLSALRKTGMAVAIDIGHPTDIHPKNKQEVGRRLCLAAEAIQYDKQIAYSGPIYKAMATEGDAIRVSFNHVDGGLMAKGGELKGFEIAGADQKFTPAEAKIDGETIVVRANGVSAPAAVRYAWKATPVCNLYNKADLPASPFRTDNWPGETINAR